MRENIIKMIKEILSENNTTLNVEILDNTNLKELGMSSFDLASLTVMIEDEFDVDVFEEGLVLTFGEIITVLEKKL
jgi:acyl carrier protein